MDGKSGGAGVGSGVGVEETDGTLKASGSGVVVGMATGGGVAAEKISAEGTATGATSCAGRFPQMRRTASSFFFIGVRVDSATGVYRRIIGGATIVMRFPRGAVPSLCSTALTMPF